MAQPIHVCCGRTDSPHDPVRMRVDQNGLGIYRKGQCMAVDEFQPGMLFVFNTTNEEKEWLNQGKDESRQGALQRLFAKGGEYYGDGDRHICDVCGATIVWRI